MRLFKSHMATEQVRAKHESDKELTQKVILHKSLN
jgi:hypothetical protein